MSHQYVVMAAGHALYGPFDTAEAARDWALHPNRTPDVRFRSSIVPLFGGVLLDDDAPANDRARVFDRIAVEVEGVQHLHAEYVEGCFRCDLSRDEARRWTGVARP